jgi:hypothetical protein
MGVSEIFDIFRRPGHGLILSLSKDEEGRRPVSKPYPEEGGTPVSKPYPEEGGTPVSKDDGVSCVAGQRACP